MKFLRRVLFSTGWRGGLTIGCLGLVLIALAMVQDRDLDRVAIGRLVTFVGFTWAAMTAYLKRMPADFGCGLGIGIVVAMAVGAKLDLDDAGLVVSCLAWACVFLLWLLVEMVAAVRKERDRADHWIQIVREERITAGRNPETGERQI